MGREIILPPSAASLSTSMRDIGYSLETAIADLIDNSISANASNIKIFTDLTGSDPVLTILDDGEGMDRDEVIASMRHGVTNPKDKRTPDDLGRFGLGLKTASFSQCRRLTVVSAQNGVLSGAEWDLDLVDERDDWIVTELNKDELNRIPFREELGAVGTIVIWRSLDRLFEDTVGQKREKLVYEKLDVVGKHLALVFHRFLETNTKRRKTLSIAINGYKIEPFNPFCPEHKTTQLLPLEVVHFGDAKVRMTPYILPHYSKLTASEFNFYQDRSDFLSNQGAYIYRNARLMAWGDWFRLIPKGEATKLARIQIDFPSNLDELWTIDIKKSRAKPPPEVKDRLRQIIEEIAKRSGNVIRGRGKKVYDEIKCPIWDRYADHGNIRYSLNREHPLVESLYSNLDKRGYKNLELLLEAIASALPIETIYSDYSTHPKDFQNHSESTRESIVDKLQALKVCLFDQSESDEKLFRQVLQSMRSFGDNSEIIEEFIRTEFK